MAWLTGHWGTAACPSPIHKRQRYVVKIGAWSRQDDTWLAQADYEDQQRRRVAEVRLNQIIINRNSSSLRYLLAQRFLCVVH